MTPIRPIQTDEIATFTGLGDQPERAGVVRDWLERMFASGAMRPAWYIVAEGACGPVGRVALWTMPTRDTPLDFVLLDAQWYEPCLTTGARLLRKALRVTRVAGAASLGHVLDTPAMAPTSCSAASHWTGYS